MWVASLIFPNLERVKWRSGGFISKSSCVTFSIMFIDLIITVTSHSHTNYHPYVSVLMFYRAMKGNIYKTFINTNLFIHIIALGKVILHTHTHKIGQPRKVSMYKIYVQIQWTHITFTAEHKQKFKLRKCHFQNNVSSFWLWWKQQNVGQIDVIAIWKS